MNTNAEEREYYNSAILSELCTYKLDICVCLKEISKINTLEIKSGRIMMSCYWLCGSEGMLFIEFAAIFLKPQDSFGELDKLFLKCSILSENTIKPSCNCFEWLLY